MKPLDEFPGETSKSKPVILMVQEEDLTTLAARFSSESRARVQAPGLRPSDGMKSVCFHPHESQIRVIWVCSPKYGISVLRVNIVNPSSEWHKGHGCSTLLSMRSLVRLIDPSALEHRRE